LAQPNEATSQGTSERCPWNAMETQGLPVLVSLRQGESGAWWSRRRLPEEEMQLAGSKDGGCVYTELGPGSPKWKCRFKVRIRHAVPPRSEVD